MNHPDILDVMKNQNGARRFLTRACVRAYMRVLKPNFENRIECIRFMFSELAILF